VQAGALRALSHVAAEGRCREAFLEAGCLARVVELASSPHEGVHARALRIIGNVATGDNMCVQAVLNAGLAIQPRSGFTAEAAQWWSFPPSPQRRRGPITPLRLNRKTR
jgi:hypothetical protein